MQSGAIFTNSTSPGGGVNRFNAASVDGSTIPVTVRFSDGGGLPTVPDADNPHGMAISGTTLYFSDLENDVVRKVDLLTSTVSTVAGCSGIKCVQF